MQMMRWLMAWMDRLEESSKQINNSSKQDSVVRASLDLGKSRVVVCYHCGQKEHFACNLSAAAKYVDVFSNITVLSNELLFTNF